MGKKGGQLPVYLFREFPASLRSGKKFAEGKSEGQTFPKPPACREAGSG